MGNVTPDDPTSLGPGSLVDDDTGWTNDNTPTINFTLSDPDTVQEVQFDLQIATDSGVTALTVHFTSTLQAQGATSFTVGQSGGTYAVGSAGMTLADNGTGYWWRVKAVDEFGAEGAYSDAGAAGTADFRVDTTPPSGGAVLDGTGADVDLNDGSLTTMSANWSGFTDALSGVAFYEYSVGTTPGATDIKGFTSTGVFTTTTDTGLVLQTGQTYYFNVRATDVASNTMTSTVSSDGQAVLPTLTVEVSTTTVALGNFNPQNSNTQTTTVSVTISTNAYNGYVIRMFALDFLRSVDNPAVIIPDFSAGTYALPAEWSGTGWRFNSGDCALNGGLFWTGPSCSGNPKYAPITQTAPGNVVGDHTAVVTGATGPIVSEQVVINLRATTAVAQEGSLYSVDLVFIVVPNY